jgi:hypothetical protein
VTTVRDQEPAILDLIAESVMATEGGNAATVKAGERYERAESPTKSLIPSNIPLSSADRAGDLKDLRILRCTIAAAANGR